MFYKSSYYLSQTEVGNEPYKSGYRIIMKSRELPAGEGIG